MDKIMKILLKILNIKQVKFYFINYYLSYLILLIEIQGIIHG